jgi:adenylate cyclase
VTLKINLPDNYMVQASLAAACAMNGQIEKAKQTLDHLFAIRPDYPQDPRAPFRTRGMPKELRADDWLI